MYTLDSEASRSDVIAFAKYLTAQSLRKRSDALSSPQTVRDYLSLHFIEKKYEHFWCLFLDNRHRVIHHEVVSTGTIDSAAVYPRVIVEKALRSNAAAVIFAHNHPSGVAEPSDTDVRLTKKLIDALGLLDIRVLDHLIVGHGEKRESCRTRLNVVRYVAATHKLLTYHDFVVRLFSVLQ